MQIGVKTIAAILAVVLAILGIILDQHRLTAGAVIALVVAVLA